MFSEQLIPPSAESADIDIHSGLCVIALEDNLLFNVSEWHEMKKQDIQTLNIITLKGLDP